MERDLESEMSVSEKGPGFVIEAGDGEKWPDVETA